MQSVGGGPQWANPQGNMQPQPTQQQMNFQQQQTAQQQEQELFAPFSTLDEPVKETIMRDVRSVASKLKVVLLPMDRSVSGFAVVFLLLEHIRSCCVTHGR
jgi:hypothetical protein